MQLIHNWINGSQDYFTGVLLYKMYGSNNAYKIAFASGKSDFNFTLLKKELRLLMGDVQPKPKPIEKATPALKITTKDFADTDLYKACLNEAILAYKDVMNKRAILFAMTKVDGFEDVNREDRVIARSKLAVDVVMLWQKMSKLFDRAGYVKENGKLPNDVDDNKDDEIDAIPDALVKQHLDNLRKNINKIKKREQTPERIELLKKNEAKLLILIERWRLLKPTQ